MSKKLKIYDAIQQIQITITGIDANNKTLAGTRGAITKQALEIVEMDLPNMEFKIKWKEFMKAVKEKDLK